jgi:hypothetical protein
MQYNGLCTFLVNRALQPHQRCPYFDVVVGLERSYELESYAGSSLASGRISHARQVKGDGPEKKGYLGPPGWGPVTGRKSQVRQSYPRE